MPIALLFNKSAAAISLRGLALGAGLAIYSSSPFKKRRKKEREEKKGLKMAEALYWTLLVVLLLFLPLYLLKIAMFLLCLPPLRSGARSLQPCLFQHIFC